MDETSTPSSPPTSPPLWAQEGDGHVIIHIPANTTTTIGIDHNFIVGPTPIPEQHHHQHSPPLPPPVQSQVQQPPSPPRRRLLPPITTAAAAATATNYAPSNRRQTGGGHIRRYLGTYREKWDSPLHVLMLLVFLCVFLLWWFSSPVTLKIEDGRIIAEPAHQKPASLNDTELTLSRMAILAVATSPNPNVQFILSILGQAGDPSPMTSSK